MNYSDTIAAIATGDNISAIGIVRISGAAALTAADNIFRAYCGIKLKDAADRKMYYGEIIDTDGTTIDVCMCTVSRAPNSYTGEDTAEFHCHGSPVILSEVLQYLLKQGVRLAEAGEFTKRSFLNGKMDLTQVEAVIDIIEAETPFAAKNAAGQLRGTVSVKIDAVYEKLVDIMAHFHAVIDYPDEDIDDFHLNQYKETLQKSKSELQRLLETHERGKIMRTGIPTAIVGRTNTGKSTLLNALLGYERAIVTDVHGTTRDTVEEKAIIGDVLLRLIDTAGLRDTEDTVEKLGLKRTLAAISEARLILVVLDGSQKLCGDDYKMLETVSGLPADVQKIIVVNKADLPQTIDYEDITKLIIPIIRLSALTGEWLDLLIAEINRLFPKISSNFAGEIISNVRQADAIGRAIESISAAEQSLTAAVSPDAVLTTVEDALAAIGEVTGKTVREDVISRIFERFCVGK